MFYNVYTDYRRQHYAHSRFAESVGGATGSSSPTSDETLSSPPLPADQPTVGLDLRRQGDGAGHDGLRHRRASQRRRRRAHFRLAAGLNPEFVVPYYLKRSPS